MKKKKLSVILDEAKELIQKGITIEEEEFVDSGRANLCSDEEN